MEKPSLTALNLCTNCGAQTEYNYLTATNTCNYCGAKFKLQTNEDDEYYEDEDNSGCIPFKNDKAFAKDKILHWLIEGERTPVNILTASDFSRLEKIYYPISFFSGTYNGYYNTESVKGKTLSAPNTINGNFEVHAFTGDSDDPEQKAILNKFAKSINNSVITPLVNVDVSEIEVEDNPDLSEAWEKDGISRAAAQVYDKLEIQNPDSKVLYKHYLDYELQSATVVYIPCWHLYYDYEGDDYNVYIDDTTGEISGSKPTEQFFQLPDKKKIIKKYALVGFVVWLGILFLRAFFAAFFGKQYDANNNELNNVIFSPPLGFYWFIRGLLFVVVYPIFMATIFYGHTVSKHFNKLKKVRQQSLDLILTGKAPHVF